MSVDTIERTATTNVDDDPGEIIAEAIRRGDGDGTEAISAEGREMEAEYAQLERDIATVSDQLATAEAVPLLQWDKAHRTKVISLRDARIDAIRLALANRRRYIDGELRADGDRIDAAIAATQPDHA